MPMRKASFHLGLIGWPLGHSLSPVMHTAALKAAGLTGDYALFPIPPATGSSTGLSKLCDRLNCGEIDGLNVTIPHKQTVISLLDELTPAARSIGAVNTIYSRDNQLIGDNTDWLGFSADLAEFLPCDLAPIERKALVLGAGGSARAVVYALTRADWQVTVAARRLDQARQLACEFTTGDAPVVPVRMDATMVSDSIRLIVNTTPVGMTPNINESPWPDAVPLPVEAFLYDLIYNPEETALMKFARSFGLTTTNGLGMLAGQAAKAFEIWTGVSLPVEIFRQAVNERMPA